MSDANVRIPEEAKDQLAAITAAEGLSLRACLAHLADSLLAPRERIDRAAAPRVALQKENGYAPPRSRSEASTASWTGVSPKCGPVNGAMHIVLDENAMAAVDQGDVLASRLIHCFAILVVCVWSREVRVPFNALPYCSVIGE